MVVLGCVEGDTGVPDDVPSGGSELLESVGSSDGEVEDPGGVRGTVVSDAVGGRLPNLHA